MADGNRVEGDTAKGNKRNENCYLIVMMLINMIHMMMMMMMLMRLTLIVTRLKQGQRTLKLIVIIKIRGGRRFRIQTNKKINKQIKYKNNEK